VFGADGTRYGGAAGQGGTLYGSRLQQGGGEETVPASKYRKLKKRLLETVEVRFFPSLMPFQSS
jgi:hypothetical protein